MARRARRANVKGRSRQSDRHARIHQWMANSLAFRELDPFEVRILLELYLLYNGNNNGHLFLSVREAARRCNMGKNKAGDCFKKLQSLGFIRRRADEPENYKLREAHHWILSEFECFGRPPTLEFKQWKPEKESGRPRLKTARPGSGTDSNFSGSKQSDLSPNRDENHPEEHFFVSDEGHSYNHGVASNARQPRPVST